MTREPRTGFVPVAGTTLAWEMAGEGPPVVFLHGFSLDRRMWDDQVDAFAPRYTVVRYDLRGFGRSPAADVPYRHADDLAALLDHLQIDSPALVGLSMGGGAVIGFATSNPGRARALVLVDTFLAGFAWSKDFTDSLGAVSKTAKKEGLDAARREWLASPLLANALARKELAPRLRAMIEGYSGWHWLNRDRGQPIVPPAILRLSEIQVPTLAVVGERDAADFQRVAETIERDVPGARRLVMPGVGHLPNMEDPARFNDVVLDFLEASGG
ncbi:MAG: alpha/beta fold hydrolase [bacterium]